MRAEPAREGAIRVGPDRAGALRVVGAGREPRTPPLGDPTRAPWAFERVGALRRVGDVDLAPALGRDADPPTLADGLVRPEVVALADGVARPEVVALVDGLALPEVVALADGLVRPEVVALAEGVVRPEVVALPDGLTREPVDRLPTDPREDPGAVPARIRSDGRAAPEVRAVVREAPEGRAVARVLVVLRPGATALLPPVTPLATPREVTARPFTVARLPARAGLAVAVRAAEAPLAWGEPDLVGRV